MSKAFDYNETFMGVIPTKKRSYLRTFKDDYRLKRLTESLVLKKGRIADLGCGGGLLAETLPYYYPKLEIFGCDVSKTAIAYAKKFGSGKVQYEVIKNKKLPFKNNFFDACICLDVLEHIPDVDFFLREVKRILKKNGQFYLIIPCEGQPFTYTWLFQKIKFGDNLTFKNWGHIHPEFTHQNVENLLNKNGFQSLRITYSEHFFYQIYNYFTYFLPKILMDLALGARAVDYYDRGVIEKQVKEKKGADFFDLLRKVWLFFGNFLNRLVLGIELETLKYVSFTAWKLNILTVVKK